MDDLTIFASWRGKGDTADAYYRVRAPWSVNQTFGASPFHLVVGPLDSTVECNVVWAQRPNSAEEELILRVAKHRGLPVIVDIDDNLFEIPPSAGDIFDHYFSRGVYRGDVESGMEVKAPLAHHQRSLSQADIITVPTLRLARGLAPFLPAGASFRVLPNYVLRGDWDWIPDTLVHQWHGEKPVIGWFGHKYHSHDLVWISSLLVDLARHYDFQFVIAGMPEVISLLPSALVQSRLWLENIVPFKHFGRIRELIKTFDIGICPLMDIQFNRGKSFLKALQFGAAGVPPVCSATVYDQVPELEEMGLVAQDLDEFGEILASLLEDVEKREALGQQWQETVFRRYCYESAMEWEGRQVPNAHQWLALAQEMVS